MTLTFVFDDGSTEVLKEVSGKDAVTVIQQYVKQSAPICQIFNGDGYIVAINLTKVRAVYCVEDRSNASLPD